MKFKSSYLLAGVIAFGVAGWMLSDNIMARLDAAKPDDAPSQQTADRQATAGNAPVAPKSAFSVAAVRVQNVPITRTVRASGVTEAKFDMTVSSKADGQIIKIDAVEGRDVKVGDVLIRLELGTLAEQIAAADANLDVARKRLEVAKRLAKENFSAPLELAEREAAVANAIVALSQLKDQLADRVIVAPVTGHLETLHVETGERVRRDTPTATILGLDTLSVKVAVPQTDISRIKAGSAVTVTIAGAGTHRGIVSKISAKSNAATRTFDVTIDLANKARKLRAGMSVEAVIDAGTVDAFGMSPAHLSVGDDGGLMAKIAVDGVVVMTPIEIVRSGAEQVYVAGLPSGAVLLTVGQAFVDQGAAVTYRLADET
jgi:multidrug efflux system membrane fusion protein